MSAPAWAKEKRKNGYVADVDKLASILARWPGESVTISHVYATPRRGRDPWWRVSVGVGQRESFSPRFEAFDDATSFRLAAVEMATSKEG